MPAAAGSGLCAGGRQGKLPVTAFEAFDLETRSWTRYPSMPSRRAFAACAMADGVVFSLGGLQQPGPHNFYSRPHFVNTVEMFDPAQGELFVVGWELSLRVQDASLGLGEGCLCPRDVVPPGSEHQPLAAMVDPALCSWSAISLGVSWSQCPEMPASQRGAPAGDAHTLSPPGAWSKSSRAIRMREKRADFVAGCLGGRVVAVGGLGNARGRHVAVFPSPSFVVHQ